MLPLEVCKVRLGDILKHSGPKALSGYATGDGFAAERLWQSVVRQVVGRHNCRRCRGDMFDADAERGCPQGDDQIRRSLPHILITPKSRLETKPVSQTQSLHR